MDHIQVLHNWFAARGDATLRVIYDLSMDNTVWDVGGFDGLWTFEMWRRYRCNFVVFEPMSDTFEKCKRTLTGIPNIVLCRCALGAATGNVDIYCAGTDNDAATAFKAVGTAEVCQQHSVADAVAEFGVPDMIKLNIEGGEYAFLEAAIACELLAKVRDWQIQFHTFESLGDCVARRDTIRAELSKTHHLTYDFPFVWENWRKNDT